MNVVIIEDEKPSARNLKRMLADLGIEVSTMLHSVEESISWFQNNGHPDVILLDIQLSDGLSFEIFDEVDVQSAVIFATAYDEYALQAFKLNSVDYLLKPIDPVELKSAVEKYKKRLPVKSPININFEEVKKWLVEPRETTYKKRFSVKVGKHIKLVEVGDIECLYSAHKGTYLFTKNGRSYPLDGSLELYGEQLDPDQFFRINRKYLIAVNSIEDIIAYGNSRLLLKLKKFAEEDVIVAREKVSLFKSWLNA